MEIPCVFRNMRLVIPQIYKPFLYFINFKFKVDKCKNIYVAHKYASPPISPSCGYYETPARGRPPASADSQRLEPISPARAGNASLRARAPKFKEVYALRARGMRPCVPGYPMLQLVRTSRAGNASLRARIP